MLTADTWARFFPKPGGFAGLDYFFYAIAAAAGLCFILGIWWMWPQRTWRHRLLNGFFVGLGVLGVNALVAFAFSRLLP